MTVSRRVVMLGALALMVRAAAAGEFDPVADAGFDRWKAIYRKRALARGLPADVVDGALSVAQFLPGVVARDRNQFEFSLAFEDYLAITNSEERVKGGRKALSQKAALLGQIEVRYGVAAPVIAALWGIESYYGQKRGEVLVLSSLATLTYDGRRAEFFEGQLNAALQILARGDVVADRMTGGWAGAMGHTQVIPTSYLAFAQDFRGDGRADVWGDDPTDALVTAAHYLQQSGWKPGRAWGQEVLLPQGLVSDKTRKLKSRSMAAWEQAGVVPARGAAFRDTGSAGLIAPAGPQGPAFLTWANFQVLKRYNPSDFYALGLGLLSDRIAGGPGLVAGFAPDRNGLTQADRILLQKRLTAMGWDCGSVDGVFGPKTEAAIRAWQTAQGLPVTGVASPAMVAALR